MTQRNVGEILDGMVAYQYVGVPRIVPEDSLGGDLEDGLVRYRYEAEIRMRRPRLASFTFSSLLRTPVHDLPHDGVGVLALPEHEWRHWLRALQSDLPSEIDLLAVWSVGVESW